MGTRVPRLPESTGDVEFSNNRATVWGLQGLPMQEVDVNSRGVLYLDPSLERWSIQEGTGDVLGNWPYRYVNGIRGIAFDVNAAPPLHGQVPSFSDTNGSLSWVDTNALMGTAGGDLRGSYPNPIVDAIQTFDVNAAAPINGQILQYSTVNNKWNPVALPSSTASYSFVCDEKAAGTNGGASTGAGWQTRTLNTEIVDGIGVSISSSRVTIPAGTYTFKLKAPHGTSGAIYVRNRLFNYTDTAVIQIGTSEYIIAGNVRYLEITGQFTIADSKEICIQYYVSTGDANTYALGLATNASLGSPGTAERYTELHLWKVA